jgi:probable HAF family extracellular repeat protein
MKWSKKFLGPLFSVLIAAGVVYAAPVYNIRDLGTLGGNWSKAWGINNQGNIAGAAYVAGNVEHAALWQAGVPAEDLGTLGGKASRAHAINDNGVAVGYSDTGSGTRQYDRSGHAGRQIQRGVGY